MTPENRADQITAEYAAEFDEALFAPNILREFIVRHIQETVEAEREACARICESMADWKMWKRGTSVGSAYEMAARAAGELATMIRGQEDE